MVWKKVNNSDAGDATHFGGNDIDKISNLFNGTADVDTVDINSMITFRNLKFRIRNPANTFSYGIQTSAINNHYVATLPLLTADDTFAFTNHAQTLANKTIDAPTVDFGSGTILPGFGGDPTNNKWGSYQPLGAGSTNSTVGILDGSLGGHTPTGGGTASNTWDATEGFLVNHATSASSGTIAGLVPPTYQFRRTHAASAKIRWQASSTTSTRLYMGFSQLSTLPVSDTPLGTADHGIIVGFSTADTNFTARGNDGSGTATSYNLGVAKNANFNTMEINWQASGSANVILNGVTTTISTVGDLPGTSNVLSFHAQIQTASATARTVSIKGVWVTSA